MNEEIENRDDDLDGSSDVIPEENLDRIFAATMQANPGERVIDDIYTLLEIPRTKVKGG